MALFFQAFLVTRFPRVAFNRGQRIGSPGRAVAGMLAVDMVVPADVLVPLVILLVVIRIVLLVVLPVIRIFLLLVLEVRVRVILAAVIISTRVP